jgi:uncharacterized protein YhaN
MRPEALRDWLSLRATALTSLATGEAAGRRLQAAEAAEAEAHRALSLALDPSGMSATEPLPFALLLARAEARLEAAGRLAGLHHSRAEAARLLARRESERAEAANRQRQWQSRAHDLLTAAGLPGDLPLADLRRALVLLERLPARLAARDLLADRVAKMAANQQQHRAELAECAALLGLTETDPAALWQALSRRITEAETAEASHTRLQSALARAQEAAITRQAEAARQAAETARRCAHFGVSDLAGLRQALADRAEADRLIAEQQQKTAELTAALEGADPAASRADLAMVDAASTRQEFEALSAESAGETQALNDAFARHKSAAAALEQVGGDDAVARLETEKQTLTLEIEAESEAYLRLRLGLAVLDTALARYRDSHRSGMMERASSAFSAMSNGAYRGLTTQPGAQGDVVIAQAANGATREVAALSQGTRDQLYLALRIARYHELAAERSPVPFVADDIMESFDDTRAAATFCLLAEMAGKGQVIYLTHHAHLCEIARTACPGVTIHQLPD